MLQSGGIHFSNRPCAAKGLDSYRYKGPYGFIMIGANSDQEAFKEAARSMTSGEPAIENLQIWNGIEYVNIEEF